MSERFSHEMGYVLLYTAVALGLGVVASLVLARAIKRATFGMEPSEIVALVQEREAMLHGIREGVIAVDSRNRVNVLNEEARRLLAIPTARIGDPIEELLPPGQLREIVLGTVTGVDRTAVTDDHLLVLNRMPVNVGSRKAGWVVTIRDRTELEGLLRQLDTVSGLTTALRAQEHEFSNRLHVMSVLLELGEIEEATRYSSQLRTGALHTAEDVRARIGSKVITALLLAKTTLAAERDVLVTLDPSSRLDFDDEAADLPLVTLIGNLVDNAIDAICDDRTRVGRKPRGEVTVHLGQQANDVLLTVSDDGPGIEASRLDEIFVDGYTTKAPRDGHRRGIGLALVHRLVTRAGGSIEATSPGGARFEVRLPMRVRESVQ